MVEAPRTRGWRAKEEESKYCSKVQAELLRSVRRERLDILMRTMRMRLVLAETKAVLVAARMALLGKESRTGSENSLINSQFTSVYLAVIRGTACALAAYLVVALVRCWTSREGLSRAAAWAKEGTVAFVAGGGG